jgi:hypothetical protein
MLAIYIWIVKNCWFRDRAISNKKEGEKRSGRGAVGKMNGKMG